MLSYGMNVDPLAINADPVALARLLSFLGVQWVITVLQPDYSAQQIDFFSSCHAFGLNVAGVVAYESGVQNGSELWDPVPSLAQMAKVGTLLVGLFNSFVDVFIWGNEPDVTSPSSWTLPGNVITQLLSVAAGLLPVSRIAGPGLASGQPYTYDTTNVSIVCYHRYQTPQEYTGVLPAGLNTTGKAIWVTEYPADQLGLLTQIVALGGVDMTAAFCLSVDMVPEYGILMADGTVNPDNSYSEYVGFAKGTGGMTMAGGPPTFELGFATYAANHPEVGDPLENEGPLSQIFGDVQLTSEGLMIYFPGSAGDAYGGVRFIPFLFQAPAAQVGALPSRGAMKPSSPLMSPATSPKTSADS